MSKEENVLKYYVVCNRLKDVIRTGWKDWGVKRHRVESVAEHIFGTQMLALAIISEFNYKIDVRKVIFMLAIHEIGEAVIGDFTQFDISKAEKEKLERNAVHNILRGLCNGEEIEKLFLEFDNKESPEAQFAYFCDKLECDIQCKLYDEQNCVNLNKKKKIKAKENERVKQLLSLNKTWSEMWLKFGQEKYNYDKNFKAISDFVLNNSILNLLN